MFLAFLLAGCPGKGACKKNGKDCEVANGDGVCEGGTCVVSICKSGFGDCDSDGSNGCETTLDTVSACGSCENACADAPGMTCADPATGLCGLDCPDGKANCNGTLEDGCESDVPAGGSCPATTCGAGFGDCDGDPGNGCEQSFVHPDHCGACDSPCANAFNGSGDCVADPDPRCALACDAGSGNCNGDLGDGCESTLDADGTCPATSCSPGWGNCDGDPANGCEQTLTTSAHCSACGLSCEGGANTVGRCVDGGCLTGCAVGFADCDGEASNGCEGELASAAHCGTCGNACPDRPNATATCVDPDLGTCGVSCAAGFGNCNGDQSDGCEATLDGSGQCPTVSCTGTFEDCDKDPSNGCEADLTSAAHCGSCANACTAGTGTVATCADPSNGTCGARCAAGYGDCDADPSNGCEALDTDGGCPDTACQADFRDCDRDPSNGCEADLNSPATCGACDTLCSAGFRGSPACVNKACALDCDANTCDCDGDLSNGCEGNQETVCNNWIDDDGDNLVDCEDPTGCMGVSPDCTSGTKAIGEACTQNADCASTQGDAACLNEGYAGFPGGMCMEYCSASDPCPAGNSCYATSFPSGIGLCWKDCLDDTDCRDGYRCHPTASVCAPGCRTDSQCTVLGMCNPDDGYCTDTAEICGDNMDNDSDTYTDCDDSTCATLPSCLTCVDADLGTATGDAVATFSNLSTGDDYVPSCGVADSNDMGFIWEAPTSGRYRIDVSMAGANNYPMFEVLPGGCTRPTVGCFYDWVSFVVTEGQQYIIIVDAYNGALGDLTVDINPIETGDCDDQVDNDGDGATDCGDTDCAVDPACLVCPDADLGGAMSAGLVITNPSRDAYDLGGCSYARSEDMAYAWTAPYTGTVDFRVSGSSLYPAIGLSQSCGSVDLGCDGGASEGRVSYDVTAGETYYVVIESYYDGDVTLDITGRETGLCSDTQDNDLDGMTDCNDSDCIGDLACITCPDASLGSQTGAPVISGTTAGTTHDVTSSCSATSSAPDVVYTWTAPSTTTYDMRLSNLTWDGTLEVRDGSCTGTTLACDATYLDPNLSLALTAGQTVFIAVDGYSTSASGTFDLSILAVERGACSDGADNDGDGSTDCSDSDCTADPACLVCPDSNLGSFTGSPVVTGTTVGQVDEVSSSCEGSEPDVEYQWSAPFSGNFVFSVSSSSFWPAVSVHPSSCTAAAIDCSTGSTTAPASVTVPLTAGDSVIVAADGYFGEGDYALSIEATEAGSCSDNADNDLDGATDCADGDCARELACITCPDSDLGSNLGSPVVTGTTLGAGDELQPSCASATADREEFLYAFQAPDSGGFHFEAATTSGLYPILYLLDTDCTGTELACDQDSTGTSASVDHTMTAGDIVIVVVDGWYTTGSYALTITATESGRCTDNVDNDGDGNTDCADAACSGTLDCVVCPDKTATVTSGQIDTGSTIATGDELTPSCATSTAPEVAIEFTAPTAGVWDFDTVGSAFDTVLYAHGLTCGGTERACNNDSTGLQSKISLPMAVGETVVLIVDGNGTAAGPYVLNAAMQ